LEINMSESAAEFPPEGGNAEQDAMAAEWEAALAQQTSSGGASADAMFDGASAGTASEVANPPRR
jgi:flagellar motor switch protein FliN